MDTILFVDWATFSLHSRTKGKEEATLHYCPFTSYLRLRELDVRWNNYVVFQGINDGLQLFIHNARQTNFERE